MAEGKTPALPNLLNGNNNEATYSKIRETTVEKPEKKTNSFSQKHNFHHNSNTNINNATTTIIKKIQLRKAHNAQC